MPSANPEPSSTGASSAQGDHTTNGAAANASQLTEISTQIQSIAQRVTKDKKLGEKFAATLKATRSYLGEGDTEKAFQEINTFIQDYKKPYGTFSQMTDEQIEKECTKNNIPDKIDSYKKSRDLRKGVLTDARNLRLQIKSIHDAQLSAVKTVVEDDDFEQVVLGDGPHNAESSTAVLDTEVKPHLCLPVEIFREVLNADPKHKIDALKKHFLVGKITTLTSGTLYLLVAGGKQFVMEMTAKGSESSPYTFASIAPSEKIEVTLEHAKILKANGKAICQIHEKPKGLPVSFIKAFEDTIPKERSDFVKEHSEPYKPDPEKKGRGEIYYIQSASPPIVIQTSLIQTDPKKISYIVLAGAEKKSSIIRGSLSEDEFATGIKKGTILPILEPEEHTVLPSDLSKSTLEAEPGQRARQLYNHFNVGKATLSDIKSTPLFVIKEGDKDYIVRALDREDDDKTYHFQSIHPDEDEKTFDISDTDLNKRNGKTFFAVHEKKKDLPRDMIAAVDASSAEGRKNAIEAHMTLVDKQEDEKKIVRGEAYFFKTGRVSQIIQVAQVQPDPEKIGYIVLAGDTEIISLRKKVFLSYLKSGTISGLVPGKTEKPSEKDTEAPKPQKKPAPKPETKPEKPAAAKSGESAIDMSNLSIDVQTFKRAKSSVEGNNFGVATELIDTAFSVDFRSGDYASALKNVESVRSLFDRKATSVRGDLKREAADKEKRKSEIPIREMDEMHNRHRQIETKIKRAETDLGSLIRELGMLCNRTDAAEKAD